MQVGTLLGRARKSPVGVLGWFLLAWVALFALATYVPSGLTGAPRRALLDLAQVVMPTVAAVLCLRAAALSRSLRRRDRWAWRFFGFGFLASALAEVTWAVYELILARESPTPSVADAFRLLFYPLTLVAIVLLVRRPPGRFTRVTVVLDSLLFTLGLAGLGWQLVLAPSINVSDPRLLVMVNVAYPLFDLLLVFALVALILTWKLERVALAPLFMLASLSVLVAADMLYAWLVLQGQYSTGSIADAFWPLSYALGGLAALSLLRTAAPSAAGAAPGASPAGTQAPGAWVDLHRFRVLRTVLPYLVFPAVAAVLFLYFRGHAGSLGASGFLALGFAVLMLALVMVRQFLTLLENTQLNGSLDVLSRALEQRVAELTDKTGELGARTAQLDTLNRAATALSRSLQPGDVLATGLDLACEAAGADAGVVWVWDRDGRAVLAAGRGLGAQEKDVLADLADSPASKVLFGASAAELVRKGDVPGLADLGDDAWRWDGLLIAPLCFQGKSLGATGVLVRHYPDRDRIECLHLEESIGAQLGVALENARQYESMQMLAERDSVTGLLNHRGFHDRLDQELQRAQRTGTQFSLIMMDLDNFKLFNDTYGHPVGDDVLRDVGSLLKEALRASDVVGRYGGDEFAAILPDTGGGGSVELAHRLRAHIYDHPFESPDGLPIPLHLSYGVATYPVDARSSNELVGFADANMYLSKEKGGDMVTASEIGPDEPGTEFATGGIFGVLDGLVTAVDKKDRYTRRHSEDVTDHAVMLAKYLSLSEESQRTLRIAGLLHDVGKVGVPDAILQKPGRLTVDEYDVVKHHVQLSELIIKEVPNLSEVVEAVGAHHERFDGTGYPRGLQGEEIPRLGRILAVADAYSAMTTDRPYRKAMSHAEAKAELLGVAGTQLDPELVYAFVAAIEGQALPATGSLAGAA